MAHLQITLGGALVKFRPGSSTANRFAMPLSSPATLAQCLSDLGMHIDADKSIRLLAILNGAVIQPEHYATTPLAADDELSLMPPIQAG